MYCLLYLIPLLLSLSAQAEVMCDEAGAQSPRDIMRSEGGHAGLSSKPRASTAMHLCNIHMHSSAEHKGPGFNILAKPPQHASGYLCNETFDLSPEMLKDTHKGQGAYKNVKPGDTIEVHWVFTSCDIKPGPGLGSCLNDHCDNPLLRVESQVFLLVNDRKAADFNAYTLNEEKAFGFYQPKQLPEGTGTPVLYLGSTTGGNYESPICSAAEVSWSVRPKCALLDIDSLHQWVASDNVFNEDKPHASRTLVTDTALLSKMSTTR